MASQTRTRFIRVSESSSNSVQAGYPDKGCPAFCRYTVLQQAAHLVFCKYQKWLFLAGSNDNKPVFRYPYNASIELDSRAGGGIGGVRRFSHKLHQYLQAGRYLYLPAFLFPVRTAENRTLCRARARAAAADRSRCGFAKQIRRFSAQTISSIWMRCSSNLSRPCAASTDPLPHRGESNSVQGADVKKTSRQRRVGRAFPMAAQAESTSRNPHSDWDVVSGWRLKRKLRPGIEP